MLPEDRIRLTHMRDACESVSRFIAGKNSADLVNDQMLQFALVRAIEIIGEAAGRVSEDVQRAAPEIPWREAVGIRNRLVHAYFDVDLGILWQTAVDSVPLLQERLEKLLKT